MIYSAKLLQFKELVHGFTTKDEGDYHLKAFTQKSAIAEICAKLVVAQQIHQNKIFVVKEKNSGPIIKGVDGILTFKAGIFLGVHTADCLPILFYEPKAKIVAAVHAGWQGTLMSISQKMVKEIENLGGKAKNIVASFGPHISMCCYEIDKERASLFREKFGQDPKVISYFEEKPHLDLAYVNFLQLLEAGIKRENIEVPPSCTYCQRDNFFSFRRAKKENDKYGNMLAYISLKADVY